MHTMQTAFYAYNICIACHAYDGMTALLDDYS